MYADVEGPIDDWFRLFHSTGMDLTLDMYRHVQIF